jgi:hypothetical protein
VARVIFGFAVGISSHTVVVGALFMSWGWARPARRTFTEPAFGWGSAQHDADGGVDR